MNNEWCEQMGSTTTYFEHSRVIKILFLKNGRQKHEIVNTPNCFLRPRHM